ncbi:MAG TPA: tail fiber protein [Opitutaceae bacterium]|jgi:microcystin-dependent protein
MKLQRIAVAATVALSLTFGVRSVRAQAEPFVGQISIVAFNFAPLGWAMCNGQLLSISANTALFSLVGTYYGGDGVHTFALPDLRGRVPIHQGEGPGLSPIQIGEVGGTETVTLTVNQIPAHTHPLLASTLEAAVVSPTGAALGAKARVPLYSAPTSLTTMAPESVGPTGGGQPVQIRNPFLGLNFIIALQGIYPSRS